MGAKERVVFEGPYDCPFCGKPMDIKVVRTTIEPTVKGVTQDRLIVTKGKQGKL